MKALNPIHKQTETIRLLGGPEHLLGENLEVEPDIEFVCFPYLQEGTDGFIQVGEVFDGYRPDLFGVIKFKRVSNTNIFYAKEELI